MNAPPPDLHEIESELQASGFLVLSTGEVEAAGAAMVLGISPKTLRNWRSNLEGPPWRTVRGFSWYSIKALLAWQSGTGSSLQSQRDQAESPRP